MDDEIRIVMADDHPLVLRGLRLSIEEYPQMKVVAEAGDGELALRHIRALHPHVAVLDIDMPRLDGFGVAREVRNEGLKTRIIFLTLHTDPDMLHQAIELGARGYLLKDSAVGEIYSCVRAVCAGQMYVSPAMTAHLLQNPRLKSAPEETSQTACLTPSERRILQLIAAGKSSKEIGEELAIHYRTVENHRTNICRKLRIEGANALLRYTLHNKLSP